MPLHKVRQIDRVKVLSATGETVAQALLFRQDDQRRIRKAHRVVRVYLHQCLHVLPMLRPLFGNHDIIVLDQPPQGLLTVQPPTSLRKYMACLGRPGREHRTADSLSG